MKKITTLVITIVLSAKFTIAQNEKLASLEGYWKSLGYGYIVNIDDTKVQLFDSCKIACTPQVTFSHKEFQRNFKIHNSSENAFTVEEGISEYDFVRIEKLPDLCQEENSKKQKDPLYNFDVLWTTFNEHFAYFKERNIDWQAMRTKYRSRITKDIKPFELFMVMDSLMEELNDGHSVMFIPEKLGKKYGKYQKKLRKERAKKLGYNPKPINVDKTRYAAANNYMNQVKSYLYGNINWGKINDSLAMIQINGMARLANYNIPKEYSKKQAQKFYNEKAEASANYLRDEIKGTRFIMDSILSDIYETKSCIVDIRFNGGGFDAVGMEFLKSFASKKGIAFTKKARMGDSFTRCLPIEIAPVDSAYKGKIYLLTSTQSASGAETFAMGMRALCSNMHIVGSATQGIFSDRTEKVLPNGWGFGISNEVYFDENGKNFEGIGILPDHKIEYKEKGYWFYNQIKKAIEDERKDPAIEKVLDLFRTE